MSDIKMMPYDEFIQNLTPYKKKLYWRCIKRGMKEMDLMLGGFARLHLVDMSQEQTKTFSEIIHCYDQDLLEWITNKKPAPESINTDLFQRLKQFCPNSLL